MLRHRPEPSDLAAVPRMGDVPFAPRAFVVDPRAVGLPVTRRPASRVAYRITDPGSSSLPFVLTRLREEADTAAQDAIAKAVEGVLP